MPILTSFDPTIDSFGKTADLPTDDRELDFRSLDGSSVLSWTGREWISAPNIQGLRMAPRIVTAESIPGIDGGRLRDIRTDMRSVVLPFVVVSDDYDFRTHLDQIAQLQSFVAYQGIDYVAAEGTFDLVATSSHAGERALRCTYLDGMEGVEGVSTGNGPSFSTFDVKLLACAPAWRGDEWSTDSLGIGSPLPFLSNDPAAHPWGLTESVVLGDSMAVIVTGDQPSPATIELIGPASTTHITSPQGLDLTIGAIGIGQQLVVSSGRTKSVTLDGVTRWDLLGDSPQWKPLPPGQASISIKMTDATAATRARIYGTSLWEMAW